MSINSTKQSEVLCQNKNIISNLNESIENIERIIYDVIRYIQDIIKYTNIVSNSAIYDEVVPK